MSEIKLDSNFISSNSEGFNLEKQIESFFKFLSFNLLNSKFNPFN